MNIYLCRVIWLCASVMSPAVFGACVHLMQEHLFLQCNIVLCFLKRHTPRVWCMCASVQEHLRSGGSSEESPRSDTASEEPRRDGPGGGTTSVNVINVIVMCEI